MEFAYVLFLLFVLLVLSEWKRSPAHTDTTANDLQTNSNRFYFKIASSPITFSRINYPIIISTSTYTEGTDRERHQQATKKPKIKEQ